ncbi:hypothetical protein ACO0LO_22400 [Undibacterium sp. TJN25]|uniref:hypothetical protein n=1 Tax=Undibacterium sp. TJN25 TaxID=3413056 RepID=UPI003BF17A14
MTGSDNPLLPEETRKNDTDVAALFARLRVAVSERAQDACSLDDMDEVIDMVQEQFQTGRPDRSAVSRLLASLAVNDEISAIADALADAMFALPRR